ncbi:penicillin-binding protein 2 [Terrihabitans rhizophilus]|uniref:Penicillin-binding protein 2 n=1 Tax=Terrihabitans rhizophilus TaxID=3092662 RepID=A0ABU4RPI0_9HYPH|nr:penicillin-binding protein 2 [Terrihabitans sp. PJ23]MDX6805600.1 penicillin-binding protein 2 [Terrihabitans sp. PJ23]
MGPSSGRVKLAMVSFAAVYLAIGGRLVWLGVEPDPQVKERIDAEASLAMRRPVVMDRAGRQLATDIQTSSIFAEPRNMIDADEAAELLTRAMPGLDADELHKRLNKDAGFVWIKREITPTEQAAVHRLGIPGVGFLNEQRRIYPNGPIVSHSLGSVNVDNQGIAGFEQYLDRVGQVSKDGKGDLKPVELALDLNVQHAVRDELYKGLKEFDAIATSGIVMDVETGEIVAFVSVPDYDPNQPAEALKPNNINRLSVGVYEMGSTFKALTLAMALDSGKVRLTDRFDARSAMQYGRFRIDDFHPTRRILSVPEVFIHSSNIGTAKIALAVGVEGHKAFLKKLGQLDRLRTELPESAMPIVPRNWGELNTVTISYGHGLSVTPLQTLMATAALMNGGQMIPPTFLKRSKEDAAKLAKTVIRPETSAQMRYLFRLNGEKGSAKKADIPGYRVGGKTGTAEKVVNGRYSSDKVMNAFTAVFPMDAPRYAVLVMFDEPKGTKATHGFRTSGWNAAPVAGRIVSRVAPLLGLQPDFDAPPNLPPAQYAAALGDPH